MNPFRTCSSSIEGHRAWLLALALRAAWPATAASGDDLEHARIAEERAAIESRYAARERECLARFVVTSCVDDAKRDRRKGLDALRARQLKLDEARRRERTAERRSELAAKAADDARREQERAARAASTPAARAAPQPLEPRHEAPVAAARPSAPRAGHDRPAAGEGLEPNAHPHEGQAQRLEREARHRATFETRQRQAAEHREQVNAKAAERLKDRAPAAPLPVPASAPAR